MKTKSEIKVEQGGSNNPNNPNLLEVKIKIKSKSMAPQKQAPLDLANQNTLHTTQEGQGQPV